MEKVDPKKMSRWKEKFLYRGCSDLNDPEERLQSALATIFAHTGIATCLGFGILAIAKGNNPMVITMFSTVGAILLMHYPLLPILGLRIISTLSLTAVGALMVYLVASGGIQQSGHIWAFIYPPMAMFALGIKRGGPLVLLFLVVVAALVFSSDSATEGLMTTQYKVRFFSALVFIAVVSMISERSRRVAYRAFNSEIQAHRITAKNMQQAKLLAEEGSRAKSEFLANMSHELRTPLNGVIGMTSMLQAADLGKQEQEYADIAGSSAETLLNLINDILDLSKIEAGRLEMQSIEFDLVDLFQSSMKPHRVIADQKGLELHLDSAACPATTVVGDPLRLRQVVDNLVGNAIKFTEQGLVEISLACRPSGEGKVAIRVKVRDTGIGIAENMHHSIFEKFTQADGSTTRRFGGTGLGLAICKQLIDLMGGEIGAESEAGKGSTFWFGLELPRARS